MSTTEAAPSVAIETLGCKLNQYESDSLATTLENRGYKVVSGNTSADAYIVNSCTVTNKADRKSRNVLYRSRRNGGQHALVILTGCYAENWDIDKATDPERGATYVVDNARKNTIPDLVDAHFRGEIPSAEALQPSIFGFETPRRIFHTRTNLKVQDGCDNFCTFCIIPHVRGRAASRTPEEIVGEAETAIAGGSRELVLTGVNMSRYSYADTQQTTTFTSLVQKILDLPGDFRLRISSLEPDRLDDDFIRLFNHPRMTPHLHLCVQSGSDRILLQMRRMYTTDQFRSIVGKLRSHDPSFNVTTDIIVGFPGESEQDVDETINLIKETRFGHVHAFPYSPRTGTRAARIPPGISERERSARATLVRDTASDATRNYRKTLIGTIERCLIETVENGSDGDGIAEARGLGEHYVPIVVRGPANVLQHNRFVDVEITAVNDGDDQHLVGRLR